MTSETKCFQLVGSFNFFATADNDITCGSTEGVFGASSIGDGAVSGNVYTLRLNQLVSVSTSARHFQLTLYINSIR